MHNNYPLSPDKIEIKREVFSKYQLFIAEFFIIFFLAMLSHNKYKDLLLSNKFLRHSINEIQSKDHRMGADKINKISLACFDDKIYI